MEMEFLSATLKTNNKKIKKIFLIKIIARFNK